MRNEYHPWTESEINTLCQLYPTMKTAAIQELMPHRTISAIRNKAHKLLLNAVKDITGEAVTIVSMRRSGATTEEIARRMGYTKRTIYRRLNLATF